MKSRTRLRLALATFAFGLAASVGANATDVCTRCENNYKACQATGISEAVCYQRYMDCTRAGHRLCPAPR